MSFRYRPMESFIVQWSTVHDLTGLVGAHHARFDHDHVRTMVRFWRARHRPIWAAAASESPGGRPVRRVMRRPPSLHAATDRRVGVGQESDHGPDVLLTDDVLPCAGALPRVGQRANRPGLGGSGGCAGVEPRSRSVGLGQAVSCTRREIGLARGVGVWSSARGVGGDEVVEVVEVVADGDAGEVAVGLAPSRRARSGCWSNDRWPRTRRRRRGDRRAGRCGRRRARCRARRCSRRRRRRRRTSLRARRRRGVLAIAMGSATMSDWRNSSSVAVVVEVAEVGDAQARVAAHRRRLELLAVRPVAVVLDDAGDAQLDRDVGRDRAEGFDHDGQPFSGVIRPA